MKSTSRRVSKIMKIAYENNPFPGPFTVLAGAVSSLFYSLKFAIKTAGWFVIDSVLDNGYLMAILAIIIVLFIISIMSNKVQLNKLTSCGVIALVIVVFCFAKPAAEKLKFNLTLPEFFYAEKFEKQEINLKEVYAVLDVHNNRDKNMLLCTLFKDINGKNTKLIKAIVSDLKGWNIMSKLDKEMITYNAVVYANESVFVWLCSEGVINISKEKLYPNTSILSTSKKENKLDVLELAKSYSRDEIASQISLFINLKQNKLNKK